MATSYLKRVEYFIAQHSKSILPINKAGDNKRLKINKRFDRKMFDPECQNLDCPQCLLGKVYYDREIGYYCMYCGEQFNAVDMEFLIEKNAITSNSGQKSDSSLKRPAIEIKDLPTSKGKSSVFQPRRH